MSDDKQKNECEGLYQSQWYKCPNSMIDWVAGLELKPGALVVAMTIIRYTVGMRGKKSAAIPTEVFMRVLGTNREKTAYEHVRQAVESGLVKVIKKQGCVSVYSINQDSDLWHKAPVVAESASSGEKCHIGSGGKRHKVGAESATGVVAESATLIKRDINKDILKEENELEVFDRSYEVVKNQLKMAGIIPVGKPVNDDELKPEIYKFITWCNEKGIAELQRSRSVVKWFQKMDAEDRKRFYTFADEDNRYYMDSVNEIEDAQVSDERAEEIRAQHADALIGMGF
ncbi:hypothetical protein [Psychrobacter sp. BF1]|uniref:hypothetical protein n=1 Tax=Psychrobacter sp. BF1 TaxID=2821147 RepID=UPI001C4E0694|nr:hypothetical protein [Psychrobacter sp. BF1]